jgi:hypothetical protein
MGYRQMVFGALTPENLTSKLCHFLELQAAGQIQESTT